jgi:hypothetical protein
MEDDLRKSREAGFIDHLIKPGEPESSASGLTAI